MSTNATQAGRGPHGSAADHPHIPVHFVSQTTRWIVYAILLTAVCGGLAVPLGLSLAALAPFGLLFILGAAIYASWHEHQLNAGYVERKRSRVTSVGGYEKTGENVPATREDPRP
jgi:hypothetical protein